MKTERADQLLRHLLEGYYDADMLNIGPARQAFRDHLESLRHASRDYDHCTCSHPRSEHDDRGCFGIDCIGDGAHWWHCECRSFESEQQAFGEAQ